MFRDVAIGVSATKQTLRFKSLVETSLSDHTKPYKKTVQSILKSHFNLNERKIHLSSERLDESL